MITIQIIIDSGNKRNDKIIASSLANHINNVVDFGEVLSDLEFDDAEVYWSPETEKLMD